MFLASFDSFEINMHMQHIISENRLNFRVSSEISLVVILLLNSVSGVCLLTGLWTSTGSAGHRH